MIEEMIVKIRNNAKLVRIMKQRKIQKLQPEILITIN